MLNLKVPPPIVMILVGLFMWLLSFINWAQYPERYHGLFSTLVAIESAMFLLVARLQFYKYKTTVNPLKPETSSTLVTSGIYRMSRNPMYVGFYCLLLAFGIWLHNALSLMFSLSFIWYITQFQIKPEEQQLEKHFGESYTFYKTKVRRWL